jgi:hypothetical protein
VSDPFDSPESEPAPAADDPAAKSFDADPPATPPADADDFVGAPEPKRRWIHATGSTSLVATLIDVFDDGNCILDVEGRRFRVPLDNLSKHDREYVGTAAVRIAARRDAKDRPVKAAATVPPANDTAGL